MNKYIPLAVLILSCLTVGCKQKSDNNGDLPVIDVVGSLGEYRQIPMSELIADVEYIPLETVNGIMIGSPLHIIVTDTHIFMGGSDKCYAFTRKGEFISSVGRVGRGPGEWRSISGTSVDEENRIIYLDTYDKIFEYTWDGKFIRDFEKPIVSRDERGDPIGVGDVYFLRDNLFLGYIRNRSGNELHNWIIFDDKGTVVKTFDDHIKLARDEALHTVLNPGIMVSESIYLKEGINDTIFTLNRRNELVPEFVFDLGKYAFPTDVYLSMESNFTQNSITVINDDFSGIVIVRDNIFFTLLVGNNTGITTPRGITRKAFVMGQEFEISDDNTVLGLYDIASGKTELLDRDPVTRRRGLVNDIDGGLSFWPRYRTSANELVDVWEAYEMKEALTEEHFAAHPAKDPAAHAKLRALLKELDYDDNPIVAVAKLK